VNSYFYGYIRLFGAVALFACIQTNDALGQTSQPRGAAQGGWLKAVVPDEVRFAIDRCKGSYNAMKNVSYTFDELSESKSDKEEIVGSVKQNADSNAEEMDVQQTQLVPPTKLPPVHIVSYITDRELGAWLGSGSVPEQHTYLNREAMSDRASALARRCIAPHPEMYAFGRGDTDILLSDPSNFRSHIYLTWKMEKVVQNNRTLVRLTESFARRVEPAIVTSSYTYLLDPEMGYAVVRFTFAMQGTLVSESNVTIKDWTGKHAWYPEEIVARYYDPRARGDGSPTETTRLAITQLTINPTFAPTDFTLIALGMARGQGYSASDSEGRAESLVWRGYTAATTRASEDN